MERQADVGKGRATKKMPDICAFIEEYENREDQDIGLSNEAAIGVVLIESKQ